VIAQADDDDDEVPDSIIASYCGCILGISDGNVTLYGCGQNCAVYDAVVCWQVFGEEDWN
tara:strand:- start:8631 stop:8810 length:180 start_codon:yes stop_codon:yes gene_type:complete